MPTRWMLISTVFRAKPCIDWAVLPDCAACQTCREARSGVLRASLCTAPHELRAERALVDAREGVPTNDVVMTNNSVTATG